MAACSCKTAKGAAVTVRSSRAILGQDRDPKDLPKFSKRESAVWPRLTLPTKDGTKTRIKNEFDVRLSTRELQTEEKQ